MSENTPSSDFRDLARILADVVPIECAQEHLLTLRFLDGTRLSFIGGPSGKLNVVLIQKSASVPEGSAASGKDIPEISLTAHPPPPRPEQRSSLAKGRPVRPWILVTSQPCTCTVCGGNLLPTLHVDTSRESIHPVDICMGCLQAILIAQACPP